jgi:hypothetical protein
MPGLTAPAVIADPELPTLQAALDTWLMVAPLAGAAGLRHTPGMSCTAQVVAHKPGQRCTIAYTIAGPAEEGERRVELMGKLYSRPVLATRIGRWMNDVREQTSCGDEPFGVPAPLMVIPDLGLLVRERAPGSDLRHGLGHPAGARAVGLSARWLARLHGAPAPSDLKPKSLGHELSKVDAWAGEVAPRLSTAGAHRLERAGRRLRALAESLPERPLVPIHRDFYYANLLWDGARVWVLDFDELSLGDPALDVGHFLAHLELVAYRTTGRLDAYAGDAALFTAAYAAERPLDAPRIGLYRAYTFLKLAATETRRRRGGWLRMTRMLSARACAEAERADVGAHTAP